MSFPYRYMSGSHTANLGTLTTSGSNTTLLVTTPSGDSDALLQQWKLTQYVGLAEVWVPLGIYYTITTSITTPAAVVQLQFNGENVTGGGVATLGIASSGTTVLYAPFSKYTIDADDAPAGGDTWAVTVTTTSGAGVVNPVLLRYVTIPFLGVSDGVSV